MDNEEQVVDTTNTAADLVAAAAEQKPTEFQELFNKMMADRIAVAVDDRKIELAQSMFTAPDEVEAPVEEPDEAGEEPGEDVEADPEDQPEEEDPDETA